MKSKILLLYKLFFSQNLTCYGPDFSRKVSFFASICETVEWHGFVVFSMPTT